MASSHAQTARQKYLAGHIHRNIVLPKNAPVATGSVAAVAAADLLNLGRNSVAEALSKLKSAANGLTNAEAARRRLIFGANNLGHEKPPAWWYQLLSAFVTPFTLILIALALTSFVSDVILSTPEHRDPTKIIIIGTIIFLSGGIRFWQEFKSQKAAQELKNLVRNKTAIIRRSTHTAAQLHMATDWPAGKELPVADLVPGDIIRLSAGDMIPADVRLIWSDDLYVSQSALTGESVPVEKSATVSGTPQANDPLELPTLCFTGTNVVSGAAVAVVVATGRQTYLGVLAKKITEKRPLTSFDKGVNSVGWLLIRFMLVMVPIVFLVNGLTKGGWPEAFFFAIAVAVGLTPEILPMVVTANLAKGAIRMAKKKTIVKKLNAIQNFGAMDILCTDKTGTLTENRIVLMRHLDAEGNDSSRVLELAYLNSTLQTGLRNLLDDALIHYEHHSLKDFNPKAYKKIDEIPFDFTRRRMSVIVQNDERILICKGAVEELLKLSTHIEHKGVISPMTPERRKRVLQLTKNMNAEGLRVIAVGYRRLHDTKTDYRPGDEHDLILSGYIGFLDPAKPSARQALLQLAEYGIATKIITGDNEIVTQKICADVGFQVTGVLLGTEIEKLNDDQLAAAATVTNVFAKVDPLQKARIIAILKRSGHTVGYMGDGVNDAAAMRQADVGISVDSGVDIAKEAADIILLEHDLGVLNAGVIEGRTVFGNILKYIKMTASSNFGNVFSVVIASAFLPFLPMLPIQLLIQNLLYDISQLSIPWDNMDQEFLIKPRKWEAKGIAQFMFTVGPVSSLFDIATFAVMWFVFAANTPAAQSLFQSGWFVMGLVSQTLVIHLIRTRRIPFLQSRASWPVVSLTVAITIMGIVLPFTHVGRSVGLQALPLAYFGWLAALLAGYFALVQVTKNLYVRRFKSWL